MAKFTEITRFDNLQDPVPERIGQRHLDDIGINWHHSRRQGHERHFDLSENIISQNVAPSKDAVVVQRLLGMKKTGPLHQVTSEAYPQKENRELQEQKVQAIQSKDHFHPSLIEKVVIVEDDKRILEEERPPPQKYLREVKFKDRNLN